MQFRTWVVLLFLTSVFVVGIQQPCAEENRRCTIKQLVGSVKIRRGSAASWSDARPNMPLKETDALRTYMEAEAEVMISDGSVIKVGENTTIELKQLYGDTEKQNTSVKILNGAILANVKKLAAAGSSFEFETPTATAAIRGTVVGFEVSKEQTKVKVYEGKVWVVPHRTAKGMEIQPNQMGVVKKGISEVTVEKLEEKSPVVLSTVPSDSSAPKDSATADTAQTADSTITDTSGQSSVVTPSGTALTLSITAPVEGAVIAPLSPVTVSGSVTPSGATVFINGKPVVPAASGQFKIIINAPEKSGQTEILINAESQGQTKAVTRKITVQNGKLQFTLAAPTEGLELRKPFVTVSGTVTPGAEVTVMSIRLPVTSGGSFAGQIPIANEAGDYSLEFDATLEGASRKITRHVKYKPEYHFTLTSPADRQTVSNTMLTIKGEVLPTNAEVSVLGRRLPVSATGVFSGIVTIPDEEGEVQLEFEINAPGISKTEIRKITYTRPPDLLRPQISASVAKSCWSITVFDRSVDEEITLWSDIDGTTDSRSMRPNESTCIPFEDGIHTYSVYAEDKAGNISSTETLRDYPYLSGNVWYIKLRKPPSNIIIDLPPASPAGEQAIYPVELTIEKLPDDNMKLIREVVITNKTNGRKVYVRNFTDNFISADIELVRNKLNVIQVDANDINNITKNQVVQVQVR